MDKINWKLRKQNPATVCALVSALIVFVYSVAGAFGWSLSLTIDQCLSAAAAILTLITGVGIVVDPTTHGLKDSTQVMAYDEPRKDLDNA